MKKVFAILLSIFMITCFLPSFVFATGDPIMSKSLTGANVALSSNEASFNGSMQKPEVKSVVLLDGTDVDLSKCEIMYDSDMTNAGVKTITIKPKLNDSTYTDSTTARFTIKQVDLSAVSYEAISLPLGSESNSVNPSNLRMKLGNYVLDTDEYIISTTPDHSKAGTYYMDINAANRNFTGKKVISFKAGVDLKDYDVITSTQTFVYDGSPKTFYSIKVRSAGGMELSNGKEYTVRYDNNVNAGADTAKVIIDGIGDYVGSKVINFSISTKSLIDSAYMESLGNVVKNSSPKPTVSIGSKVLREGVDFDYSYNKYDDYINVIVTGRGNYSGIISKQYKVGKTIESAVVTFFPEKYEYTGYAITPTNVSVKMPDGTRLVYGKDYTLTYDRNIDVSTTAALNVIGQGSYAGKVACRFEIFPKSINNFIVNLSQTSYSYDGSAKTPAVTVRNGSTTLSSADYNVSYTNNIAIGTATVTITGKGNYQGYLVTRFNITGKNIATTNISLIQSSYRYDGYQKKPLPTVKDGYKELVNNVDYYLTYENNVVAGTAYIVVTGKGTYSGNIRIPFYIKGYDQKVSTKYTYYTKYFTSDIFNLNANATGDGTGLIYKSSDESVVKVTSFGTVQIVGTGRATITVSTTGTTKYDPASKTVTVTVKPNRAVISRAYSPASGKLKVAIKKAPGVTKYQVKYGRNGSYKNFYYKYSTNPNYITQAKTFKGLDNGKAYFVKVRGYKTMSDGTKVWGNWSKTRKVYVK